MMLLVIYSFAFLEIIFIFKLDKKLLCSLDSILVLLVDVL